MVVVGEFEDGDFVTHDVELVCAGFTTLPHLDALTRHPVIRSWPKAGQFEEYESVVAVADNTVSPSTSTGRRYYSHDGRGAAATKNGQTIQKSRDEAREQHYQDDQNDHSDMHLDGPVAAFS